MTQNKTAVEIAMGIADRVKKAAGGDVLKGFKVDSKSAMHERNHTFTGKDLEQPF